MQIEDPMCAIQAQKCDGVESLWSTNSVHVITSTSLHGGRHFFKQAMTAGGVCKVAPAVEMFSSFKSPCRGFPKLGGAILGDCNDKDFSIWGSLLGSPCFGKLPCASASIGMKEATGLRV